jgi:hypothetical protein
MKRMSLMEQSIRMPSVLDRAKHGGKGKFKGKSLSQMYTKYGKKPRMKSLAEMGKAISKKKIKSVWM